MGCNAGSGWWTLADPGSYSGFHEWIKGGWVLHGTRGRCSRVAVALWFVRFPFLTAPISFALWYMSMDLTPVLFGVGDSNFHLEKNTCGFSLGFGLLMFAGRLCFGRVSAMARPRLRVLAFPVSA